MLSVCVFFLKLTLQQSGASTRHFRGPACLFQSRAASQLRQWTSAGANKRGKQTKRERAQEQSGVKLNAIEIDLNETHTKLFVLLLFVKIWLVRGWVRTCLKYWKVSNAR